MIERAIVRFRQDLRTYDHTALYHATQQAKEVIPVFVVDQTFTKRKDDQRLAFLYDALDHLDQALHKLSSQLIVLHGDPVQEITDYIAANNIDAVFVSTSYGKGSEERDDKVKNFCTQKNIQRKPYTDYLMLDPADVEQRKVYTPFFKKRLPQVQERYQSWEPLTLETVPTTSITGYELSRFQDCFPATRHHHRGVQGIRERLHTIDLVTYDQTRNIPANTEGTTKLSPYLRFGVLSPREVYHHFARHSNPGHDIVVKELARREFWHHIMHYFPAVATQEFQAKRIGIPRENNLERFEARKEGKTGYPIIDAAMRQLKQENRMHNRVRMVVASFLTKDLLIDWRWGEQHFAQYLIDYDRNINIGNRQRSASVGPDPKPLRIFNPILQSKRFDPAAEYIYRYVPELRGQPLGAIHDPLKYKLDYHTPIMDHYEWRKVAMQRYNDTKARYLAQQSD